MKKILILLLCVLNLQAADLVLEWDAPIGVVQGYRVYAITNSVAGTVIPAFATNTAKVVATSTNLTALVTNLSNGYYRFAVTAFNETGESDFSGEIAVNLINVPSAPTNLHILSLKFSKP